MSKMEVLSAIRQALRGAHDGYGEQQARPYPEGRDPRPYGNPGVEELWQRFLTEFDALAAYEDQRFGEAWRVGSVAEARERVASLLARDDINNVCAVPCNLVEQIVTPELRTQVKFTLTDRPETAGHALAGMDLGITDCLCLTAGTASVLVSTAKAGSRAASLLPPVHLVLAQERQLVPDIPECLDTIAATPDFPDMPAAYTFITGSSRTADIEKVLVIPAHGPRELFVLLLP